MTWQAGFSISLAFGAAAALVFALSLAARRSPRGDWRLPAAAGALVADQLATWMLQQFAHLNPPAMALVDGLLAGLALWLLVRRPQAWTTAFLMFTTAQAGASLAHCFDGGGLGAYVTYVWLVDLCFVGALVTVALQSGACLLRFRRRAIQFRPRIEAVHGR